MSTGLVGRKVGDVFCNDQGHVIYFFGIDFYPEEGTFATQKELTDEVQRWSDVVWLNQCGSSTGGFAIIQFTDETDKIYRYGRFLNKIKSIRTDNFIPNKVGSYRLQTNASVKVQSGLTPQEILYTKENITSTEIVDQLTTIGTLPKELIVVAKHISEGKSLPITFNKPSSITFTAFRDYFCELLQPLALISGQYTGNAVEAAHDYMGGTFDDAKITFDSSKNTGLYDSILANEFGHVKISSKGGKGATASVTNLYHSMAEYKQKNDDPSLASFFDLVSTIYTSGQHTSPLVLGLKYNILTENDVSILAELKDSSAPVSHLYSLPFSCHAKSLFENRQTKDEHKSTGYYHALASVAHTVADYINAHTDFSTNASHVLNNSALVQVYTNAKEHKSLWTLDKFTTLYPTSSVTGVKITASKTYYSTGIKGNFTFKIEKENK